MPLQVNSQRCCRRASFDAQGSSAENHVFSILVGEWLLFRHTGDLAICRFPCRGRAFLDRPATVAAGDTPLPLAGDFIRRRRGQRQRAPLFVGSRSKGRIALPLQIAKNAAKVSMKGISKTCDRDGADCPLQPKPANTAALKRPAPSLSHLP